MQTHTELNLQQPAANTAQTLARHYARLARIWPKDQLRSVVVPNALIYRRERVLGSAPDKKPPPGVEEVNAATEVDGKVQDFQKEMEQVNALYSLLENRYSLMYKCSDELLRPRSKPTYYAELAAEMDAAPKRTWLQQKWLNLSRRVRFQ